MSQHKGVFEICPLLTGTWVYFFCVSIRNLCIGSEAEILFQLLIYRIRGLWKLNLWNGHKRSVNNLWKVS